MGNENMHSAERLERELLKEENFGKRLEFARKLQKESRQTLADAVKTNANNIWQWENDKAKPKDEMIGMLCRYLKLKKDWLVLGKGEMFHLPDATVQLKDHPEAKKLQALQQINGMKVCDRLQWAKSYREMSYQDLVDNTNMSRATLGFLFSDPKSKNHRLPSQPQYEQLAKALRVNLQWLKYGLGKVEAGDDQPDPLIAPKSLRVSWGALQGNEELTKGVVERLRLAYYRKAVSVKEVASAIGTTATSVNKHLSLRGGKCVLPYETNLYRYAKFFDVSLDWIMSGEGDPGFKWYEFDRDGLKERLHEVLEIKQWTLARVETEAQVRGGQIHAWYTDSDYGYMPKPHIFKKVVNALGVNFDWLWAGVGEMFPPETASDSTESDSARASDVPAAQEREFADCPNCGKQTGMIVLPSGRKICVVCENPVSVKTDTEIPDSPAAKYFPDKTSEVRVATLGAKDIAEISRELNRAIAKRDEHLRQADLTQAEIDKWTTILLNKVGS